MTAIQNIPAYGLYGEGRLFPEVLHVERIHDRAKGHSWEIAAHRHPHLHQFLFIRTGDAQLSVNGQAHALGQGWLVNLPPWTVHGFTFAPETDGLVVSLPVAEFSDLFETPPIASRLQHWHTVKPNGHLVHALELLYAGYRTASLGRSLSLRSLGTYVGTLIASSMGLPAQTACLSPTDTLIPKFETLVQSRFRERLKLSDYASDLRVSPSHLSRRCRQVTGVSAMRFIDSVVFKEACSQLAYTRAPIVSIGFDLGFEDAAYFSRAFRKHTGMSPSAYRKSTAQVFSP